MTPAAASTVAEELLSVLCCPSCRGEGGERALAEREGTLECTGCQARYPVEDGIPNFLPAAVRAYGAPAGDIEFQKWQQRSWHDQHELAEWNINDPHHAPLKEYCLYRQMGTAADLIPKALAPARLLNVCCGSGLEAEFFARHFDRPVVGTDISIGMLRNAAERARRAGYRFHAVCADSETLPFRTGAFDVALVLHGLHHLVDPPRGLREMARVSRGALCVFEPATSPIRRVMMRVGLVSPVEESGNASLDFSETSGFQEVVEREGFDEIVFRRELWSLRVSEFGALNRWPLRTIAERVFDFLHSGHGTRWGTKLTMVAWRGSAGR